MYRQKLWLFVKSIAGMAIILLPFYYAGQAVLAGSIGFGQILTAVHTIFAPAVFVFDVICESMQYCVAREYPGVAVMGPLYLVSVLLYGYAISLIWGWVQVPTTHTRRRYKKYQEYDEFV